MDRYIENGIFGNKSLGIIYLQGKLKLLHKRATFFIVILKQRSSFCPRDFIFLLH